MVERTLGKGEVVGSNPTSGSFGRVSRGRSGPDSIASSPHGGNRAAWRDTVCGSGFRASGPIIVASQLRRCDRCRRDGKMKSMRSEASLAESAVSRSGLEISVTKISHKIPQASGKGREIAY